MSKFYTICQNNSGGYNIQNDDVDQFVCVEADNAEMAKSKFKEILVPYREYCPCCGKRWDDYFLDEEDGFDTPTIYGEKHTEFKDKYWCNGSSIIIYYLNGKIEKYNLERNLKRWQIDTY